ALPDGQLHQLAELVTDELDARQLALRDEADGKSQSVLVDAATLAKQLNVSRSTVYEHSGELGAIEVGHGTRPRLRFDPEQARTAWTRRGEGRRSQETKSPSPPRISRRRQPTCLGSSGFLLPVKDRSAGSNRRSRAAG